MTLKPSARMCIQNFLIHVLHNDQSVVFSFLECHHPRSSLPLWCMLSAAVSAGGAVHPGAHGSRYEAWLLQEAQQRGTESLPQPARQRGRGQGAAAGGQQRITSAQGGQTPLLHLKMPCTHGQIHIIYHKDTHTPQAHVTLECRKEMFVCFAVHSTKLGAPSLAALFFLIAGLL